jgi:hypothetical protein
MRIRDYILCLAVLLATCVSTSAVPFVVPSGAAPTTDFFGELEGDNNAWATGRGALQFFDGTANTFLLGVLADLGRGLVGELTDTAVVALTVFVAPIPIALFGSA